jgi:hypothetical protein
MRHNAADNRRARAIADERVAFCESGSSACYDRPGEAARACCAIALPPSGGITPGISGEHRRLILRAALSASPLHAVIGVRGSFLSSDSVESAAEEERAGRA